MPDQPALEKRTGIAADRSFAVGTSDVYGFPRVLDILEQQGNPLETRLDHGHRLAGSINRATRTVHSRGRRRFSVETRSHGVSADGGDSGDSVDETEDERVTLCPMWRWMLGTSVAQDVRGLFGCEARGRKHVETTPTERRIFRPTASSDRSSIRHSLRHSRDLPPSASFALQYRVLASASAPGSLARFAPASPASLLRPRHINTISPHRISSSSPLLHFPPLHHGPSSVACAVARGTTRDQSGSHSPNAQPHQKTAARHLVSALS